jgi:hypothetical protein
MIGPKKGDEFRNTTTGKLYEVRSVKGMMVILQSENGKSHTLTWVDNWNVDYEKVDATNNKERKHFTDEEKE